MIGILVNGNLILKETSKRIDREANEIDLTLSLKVLYGKVVTEDLANKQQTINMTIRKVDDSDLWIEFKDATNEVVIASFYNLLKEYGNVKDATPPNQLLSSTTSENEPDNIIESPEEPSSEYLQKLDFLQKWQFLNDFDFETIELLEI